MSYRPLALARRQSVFCSPPEAPRAKPARRLLKSTLRLAPEPRRPLPAALRSRTRSCSPKTSKPVRRRRVDKPTLSRMTKTQFLTPALSRRTAGIAPARFVDTRGPPVPAARAGPCGAADGARGASHGYPSEFKVRRGRSCGCSIMRSDGINTENYSDKKHMQ